MFAGLGRTDDPVLAQTSWCRDVNGVGILRRDQCLVIAERFGRPLERRRPLTKCDELAAALHFAAGDGRHDAVAAVENGLPILPRNFGGAEYAPAEFGFFHRQIRRRSCVESLPHSIH